MAIVNVIRFNEHSGCICVDQESWFLRNRKTFISDSIFSCVPEEEGDKLGVEVILGGAGYPSFHYEVALKAKNHMKGELTSKDITPEKLRVENLSNIVLRSFQEVHRRKLNNRINFMFGFNSDDFNRECYKKDGKSYNIKQEKVRKRVEDMIDMKEKPQDHTLIIPATEACVAGISPEDGFHAYCLKEQDGVLSYYSCGFDSLGAGKYGGGSAFANTINQYTVKQRREGYGEEEGLFTIFNSTLEAWEHYSQIGGNIHLFVLDSKGKTRDERVRDISGCPSYICIEAVKAWRGNVLTKEDTIKILTGVIFEGWEWQKGEELMFRKARDLNLLDRCLRNYKAYGGNEKITYKLEDIYIKEGVEI